MYTIIYEYAKLWLYKFCVFLYLPIGTVFKYTLIKDLKNQKCLCTNILVFLYIHMFIIYAVSQWSPFKEIKGKLLRIECIFILPLPPCCPVVLGPRSRRWGVRPRRTWGRPSRGTLCTRTLAPPAPAHHLQWEGLNHQHPPTTYNGKGWKFVRKKNYRLERSGSGIFF